MHNLLGLGACSLDFISPAHHNDKEGGRKGQPCVQDQRGEMVYHILKHCILLCTLCHHDYGVCPDLPGCQEKNQSLTGRTTKREQQFREHPIWHGPRRKAGKRNGWAERWGRGRRARCGGRAVLLWWEWKHLVFPDEKEERKNTQSDSGEI